MSVREQDRQRNCPSRGLGIAAAAIGVGVGAALYYFFNKRTENPDASGSTTNWTDEEPQALRNSFEDPNSSMPDSSMSSDTYPDTETDEASPNATDSAEESHDTDTSETDTSISDVSTVSGSNTSHNDSFDETNGEDSYTTVSEHSTTDTSMHDIFVNTLGNIFSGRNDLRASDTSLDEEWESIDHVDVPMNLPRRSKIETAEIKRMAKIREQAFRERSWALEECSICFESMQRSQEVMALPCTHRFHQECIIPWLQERQTCPMCRKDA